VNKYRIWQGFLFRVFPVYVHFLFFVFEINFNELI
jgi:hypothetical protein